MTATTLRLYVNGTQVVSRRRRAARSRPPPARSGSAATARTASTSRADRRGPRLQPGARGGRDPDRHGTPGRARRCRTTTPPTTPAGLTATAAGAGQVNLSWTGLDRQRRRSPATGVERCQGAGCTNFAQVGTPTGRHLQRHRPGRLDHLPLPGPRHRRRRQPQRLLDDRHGDDHRGRRTRRRPRAGRARPRPRSAARQIDLAWTASTDNVGVTGYRVERCQGAGCTNFAQVGHADHHVVQRHRPDGEHDLPLPGARGRRRGQPERVLVDRLGDHAGGADTTPPTRADRADRDRRPARPRSTWPGRPRPTTSASPATGSSAARAPAAPTSPRSRTPTGTTFSDTGLVAAHHLPLPGAGGRRRRQPQPYSTVVNATTPALPDTTPPTVPGGLTATAAGAVSITVNWTASTDNVGVTGYRVERCQGAGCTTFAQVATPAAHRPTPTAGSPRPPATATGCRRSTPPATSAATPLWSVRPPGPTPVLPTGLVAGWSFNAGTGTTAVDSSGNGNTATLQNGATWAAGKYGNGVSFDGVDDLVRVASSASLTLTTGMTLAAWIKPAATQSGWRTIMQRADRRVLPQRQQQRRQQLPGRRRDHRRQRVGRERQRGLPGQRLDPRGA